VWPLYRERTTPSAATARIATMTSTSVLPMTYSLASVTHLSVVDRAAR
jgi:hypothetical protein